MDLRIRALTVKAQAQARAAVRCLPRAPRPGPLAPAAVLSAALAVGLFSADAALAQASKSGLWPSGFFVQAGTAKQTREFSAGLLWDWQHQWVVGPGRVTGYWEASVSRWSYSVSDGRQSAWLGQVGLIPVFRFRPDGGASPWFAEAGIGVTLTTRIYETHRKRFSTSFNFGDHIAVGRDFGARQEHSLALRLEHFSNAGIKHPNPGENFVQLRYAYRFE